MEVNDSKKGRVTLYGHTGRILDSVLYYSVEGRKRAMDKMEADFEGMCSHFHVLPFALCTDIPKKEKKVFVRVPVHKSKIETWTRPKAEYSNKSPYGIADELKD